MQSSLIFRTLSILFSIIGLIDSVYLSWIKLANQESMCAGIGGCDVVNTSQYSEIGGIPIALIGAGGFLSILVMLLIESRPGFWQENVGIYVFGLSLIGTIYSGYLTYLEIAVIKEICPFCVLSALAMLAIFVLSISRLRQGFE
jgi:uncharacterized membrane protein